MECGIYNDVDLYDFVFFQAEDGIRDLTVTGVQTCALPILGVDFRDWSNSGRPGLFVTALGGETFPLFRNEDRKIFTMATYESGIGFASFKMSRSEERRVGKECRSRWSPYH